MATGDILTKENPCTKPFKFSGEKYICIKGQGTASIKRKVGESFEIMTTNEGEPLEFMSDGSGVMFNGSIFCKNNAIEHVVEAQTTGTVKVFIL